MCLESSRSHVGKILLLFVLCPALSWISSSKDAMPVTSANTREGAELWVYRQKCCGSIRDRAFWKNLTMNKLWRMGRFGISEGVNQWIQNRSKCVRDKRCVTGWMENSRGAFSLEWRWTDSCHQYEASVGSDPCTESCKYGNIFIGHWGVTECKRWYPALRSVLR